MNTNLLPERFRSFDSLNRMMEDMFASSKTTGIWTPVVDVKAKNGQLWFTAELPGITLEDINVEVEGDVLTISGKREFSEEEKKDEYVRIERSYGAFHRSFSLGGPVKPEDIKASFADGILTVIVPRTMVAETKRIPIGTK